MATLAIKGHVTRGKEVIELLKMLGGTNRQKCWGIFENRLYVINDFCDIEDISLRNNFNYQIYTLEEFLEKFPYKVGDKVVVRERGKVVTITDMSWRNGCEVIYDTCYNNNCVSFYSAEELQPYKEETMEKTIKIDIPKGYEFARVDDDNQQVVFEKIGCRYPKTYEECCDVLGISYMQLGVVGYACEKLLYLQRLLLCRDTYWKIAGEQMGLGKPWEPDWLNVMQDKYVLYTHDNNICPNCYVLGNNILAFPTKEIRDTFYENFKDLINETKELL